MNGLLRAGLFLITFTMAHSANAAVYNCVNPGGAAEYSDKPCASGEQKAVDADARNEAKELTRQNDKKLLEVANARAKIERDNEDKRLAPQRALNAKAARENFLLVDVGKLKQVKLCQQNGCTSGEYRELLIGRPPGMLDDVLACETRELSSSRYIACPVLLRDLGRTRRAVLYLTTG